MVSDLINMEGTLTKASGNKKTTSKILLNVTGDGSSKSVVENLLRKSPDGSSKPKTFKVARSPLLDQLQIFLPQMQTSNQQLLARPAHELEQLDIENTFRDKQVVEMNLLFNEMSGEGEEMLLPSPSAHSDSESDSDSSDRPVLGAVTVDSVRIPSEARGGGRKGKSLIQEVMEARDGDRSDDEISDGEVTVASTSSGER